MNGNLTWFDRDGCKVRVFMSPWLFNVLIGAVLEWEYRKRVYCTSCKGEYVMNVAVADVG